jgi:hypothetical protein
MKRTVCLTILMGGGGEVSSVSSVPLDIKVDLVRLSAKVDKMLRILHKECPDFSNAYIVSLMVVAVYEEAFGFELSAESLAELRSIVADVVKSEGGNR